jgi:hypothetical protein
MWISKEKLEKLKKEIRRDTEDNLSDKLISYHKNYAIKQTKLANAFDFKSLDKISINIWDDFYEDGFAPSNEVQSTYAYLEMEDIPNIEKKKILEILLDYISNNSLLPEDIDMELVFYDSSTRYPILVLEHEYNLYKRWQINFNNITHKALDNLINQLKKFTEIKKIKVDIYSES